MIRNYLKIAIRNFKNNLLFSMINVVGLAIGISASLVIYLIVHYDLTFDKFHPDGERIYRVVSNLHFPGQDLKNSGIPLPLQDASGKELSGIVATAPFISNAPAKTSLSDSKVFRHEENIIYADNRYFDLFKSKWLAGSPKQLTEPNKVVLTESRAKKYFNISKPEDAIGKVIVYDDTVKTSVIGVVADFTENSDFDFKTFISIKSGFSSGMDLHRWDNIDGSTQLMIKTGPNVTKASVEKQLAELHEKYAKSDMMQSRYVLQPLSDIHFNADYGTYGRRLANYKTLYGLLTVGGILLLLACINFINLTTARAVNRAREIGVRKTMGSTQWQLILQFMSETIIITAMAALLSLVLVPFLLKVFEDFIPPDLHFNILHQPDIVLFTLSLIIIVGVVSGFYPAFVLARFNPVTALKNQVSANHAGSRNSWLRQSLTVVQFVAAQMLIIGTIIVTKQIHYVLNKNLGFDKNGIITMDLPYEAKDTGKRKVFQSQLQSIPQVEQAVLAGSAPAQSGFSTTVISYENGKTKVQLSPEVKYADESYLKFYHLKLAAGQYLQPSDSARSLLINETFAQALGFKNPADAVGKSINLWRKQLPVSGVLKDFYFNSLHVAIKPMFYAAENGNYYTLHVKFKANTTGDNLTSALNMIQQDWKKLYPEDDFEYKFLDDNIAKFYKSEQNISHLLNWATDLTILISCMGLLGLVMHTTVQRTKEIGIRKVLGASVSRIVALLSLDFLKLVLIAIIIASPLAWYGASRWMEGFAYRTSVNWWLFALAGIIAIAVAMFTISFNAVKAAIANPVKSLRSE